MKTTTIEEMREAQSCIGRGYTNTTFIMFNYKPSTLPRMFYDLKLSVKQIDNNKTITNYLKSEKSIEDGFSQDKLFEIILAVSK
jgi:hypothetical protein